MERECVVQQLRQQLETRLAERKAGKRHFTDKPYMEQNLPAYLDKDIHGLIQARKVDELVDCWEDEIYGSINAALCGKEITDEQAIYLRWKYLKMLPPDIEEI